MFVPDFAIREYCKIWDKHGKIPTPYMNIDGISHVNHRFHTTDIVYNLGLTREVPCYA